MEGIALQGLGNWQAVSEHVGTRTKEEVEEHYNNVYINSPYWPLPVRRHFMWRAYPFADIDICSTRREWIYRSKSTRLNFMNANAGEYKA